MKFILCLMAAIMFAIPTFGQDISGQWNGVLKAQGIQLRVVFNISKTDAGYQSTMDSPDQGAKGIPVTSTIFESGALTLKIANIGIEYKGIYENSNTIAGEFKQSGHIFQMNLSRKPIEKEKVIRPQEPAQPYPYYTEDVLFENVKDTIVLAGTLTLPKKNGKFPAVILISGSGPQNRDEEIMNHKPFLILADHLTKNGIAVLRFDDRGTASSTGNFSTATTNDFATDVAAAIDYLKTRKEIKRNKIGLIGHSEGGLIAPLLANSTKDVGFIVLLAGPGLRGDQILLLQQKLIGKALGISDDVLQKAYEINKSAYQLIVENQNDEQLRLALTNYLLKVLKDGFDNQKPAEMPEDQYVQLQVKQLTSPWMYNFIGYDPATTLERVKCPVLALIGEKDLQVPPKENFDAMKTALDKAKNKKYSLITLPQLNHLFQECQTGSPNEYAQIEQTFSPSALQTVSAWILNHVK